MLTIPTLAVEMAKKLPVSTLPPASGTTWCMRSVPPMQPTRQLSYLLLNHVRYYPEDIVIITPHACARGKVIGFVCLYLSVVCHLSAQSTIK